MRSLFEIKSIIDILNALLLMSLSLAVASKLPLDKLYSSPKV